MARCFSSSAAVGNDMLMMLSEMYKESLYVGKVEKRAELPWRIRRYRRRKRWQIDQVWLCGGNP